MTRPEPGSTKLTFTGTDASATTACTELMALEPGLFAVTVYVPNAIPVNWNPPGDSPEPSPLDAVST